MTTEEYRRGVEAGYIDCEPGCCFVVLDVVPDDPPPRAGCLFSALLYALAIAAGVALGVRWFTPS